jgi:GLPGLI family protein
MISGKVYYILLIFLSVSCGIKSKFGEINEGTINYNLEYSGNEKEMPILSVMPTTMTVKFNKHHAIQKVEGWLGLFSLIGIADLDKGKNYAILKVLEKRYLYEKKPNDSAFGFKDFPNMKIKYLNETKMIAGYKCKKALILIPGSKIDSINVYFTDKIKIKDPNWTNPFKQINGVLLEFQMDMFNIRTKITATSVVPAKVPDSEFNIPEDCKKVSKFEIEKVIKDLM